MNCNSNDSDELVTIKAYIIRANKQGKNKVAFLDRTISDQTSQYAEEHWVITTISAILLFDYMDIWLKTLAKAYLAWSLFMFRRTICSQRSVNGIQNFIDDFHLNQTVIVKIVLCRLAVIWYRHGEKWTKWFWHNYNVSISQIFFEKIMVVNSTFFQEDPMKQKWKHSVVLLVNVTISTCWNCHLL